VTRIRTSEPGMTRRTNIMRAVSIVGIQVTSLGSPLTGWAGGCLPARPPLRRNDTGHRLAPDVGNDLPNRTGRHHAAIRRHAARASVKNRLIQRAVGTTVAPATIDETRADPAECPAAVTTVAIHRAENLRSIRGRCGIVVERIRHLGRRGLIPAGGNVIRVSNRGWHAARVVAPTRGRDNEQD